MPRAGANIEYTTPTSYVVSALDAGCRHLRYQITGDTTRGQPEYRASLMFLANELKLRMADIAPRADVTVALMGTPPIYTTLPDIWAELAAMFVGVPGIFGFDILNEPNLAVAEWEKVANKTIRAIKGAGRFRCIVQSRRGEPGRLTELFDIAADMYSVHVYGPLGYTHQGLYSYPAPKSLDISAIRRSLDNLEAACEETRKPLYVGEFSAVCGAPGAARWLGEVIARIKSCGWHSAYHAWCPPPCPWSAEDADRLTLIARYFETSR